MVQTINKDLTLASNKLRILVLSVDFDGCIFHPKFINSLSLNRLIETNELFIQHVVKEIEDGQYDLAIFMVGSNRQSKEIDDLNTRFTKASCYPAILELCAEIGRRGKISCHVDRYLISDSYGNRPSGENFTNAIDKKPYDFSRFIWDENKYSLIYSQIHKIASENTAADICYHFYDDREDILSCISDFYNEQKDLIPFNLRLCTFLYNGKVLSPYRCNFRESIKNFEIIGEGIADSFFHENLKRIARFCGFDTDRLHSNIETISDRFYGEALKKFKQERLLKIKDIYFELTYEIKCFEQTTMHKHIDLQSLVPFFENLCNEVLKELEHVTKEQTPPMAELFKNGSAIKTACDTIKLLREFKESRYKINDIHYELLNYIELYGQPCNRFKSSLKIITNNFYSLFSKPTLLSQHAYTLAEGLSERLRAGEMATDLNIMSR